MDEHWIWWTLPYLFASIERMTRSRNEKNYSVSTNTLTASDWEGGDAGNATKTNSESSPGQETLVWTSAADSKVPTVQSHGPFFSSL